MNLMDLFIKIGVDDQASSKVGSISKKLGNGLKTAAKIGTAAVAAASTAVVGLATSAIKSYAEYEQLVGGVETLFKENASVVQGYAEQAYKTANMSANKYMETVTSFSASLLQGLGGDTAKAAEYADMAVRDMSDNANKFGTDISMIQNAYQGFAKKNYTMLDNLKLGYGGTASEMARLINDSGVLGDTVTVTASNINRVSFDKIVEAINVVQTQMGVTGTTANEASTTIQGSINAMKGAWENLKVAMVSDTGDIDQRITEFVESVGVVGDNLMPRIKSALSGIVSLVKEFAPSIINELPGLVQTLLPEVLSAAGSIVGSLLDMLLNNGEAIFDTGIDMIMMLLDGLLNALTDGQAIQKLVQLIIDLALKLTDPTTLVPLLEAALDIILALADGLIQAIPELIKAAPTIVWNLIASLLEFLPQLSTVGWDLLKSLLSAFSIEDIKEYGKNIVDGIKKGIEGAWEGIKNWFNNLWDKLFDRSVDITVTAEGRGGGLGHVGGRSSGLYYVPYNDYITRLHEGEMVLRKTEAAQYRRGLGGVSESPINITINGAQYNSEESLAEAVAYKLQQIINGKGAAYA